MNTLTAIRDKQSTYNQITTIVDSNNKVKAVLTGYNQPTKRKPFITLRGKIYNLNFIN